MAAFGRAHPVAAFKVWLFLSFLTVPLLVATAVVVLDRPVGHVAAATWVSSLIWCLDPTFRLFREFGGSGFPFASAVCLLAAALAYRYLACGGWGRALGVAGTSAGGASRRLRSAHRPLWPAALAPSSWISAVSRSAAPPYLRPPSRSTGTSGRAPCRRCRSSGSCTLATRWA